MSKQKQAVKQIGPMKITSSAVSACRKECDTVGSACSGFYVLGIVTDHGADLSNESPDGGIVANKYH
jgi:hypothetical protein